MRGAVDDAGGFVRGLWVTFVSLGTYIVIAAASVTHRQLFLETPIKLPLLDVQLPLVAFFIVAPGFFLVFHFYLLLQLVLLAAKVARYNALLRAALPADADAPIRRDLRQQLPNDILVQFLAGPSERREGAIGAMLRLVGWMTMALGPLVVLLTVQYKFLPYQDELVTWLQRGAVLSDLALLWLLWPAIASGRGALYVPVTFKAGAVALATLLVLAASGIALTFPREAMDNLTLSRAFHGVMVWPMEVEDSQKRTDEQGETARTEEVQKWIDPSLLRRTFGRGVEWTESSLLETSDWLRRLPEARRLIPGALRLSDQSFVDDEAIAKMTKRATDAGRNGWDGERSFRTGRRRLVAADLSFADLRRADLRGVTLDDASLFDAALGGVRLERSSLARASLNYAYLEGASLDGTRLAGASLDAAHLEGASLDGATLRGAKLDRAVVYRATPADTEYVGGAVTFRGCVRPRIRHTPQCLLLSDEAVERLRAAATLHVTDPDAKADIETRFARLKRKGVDEAEDQRLAAYWRKVAKTPFDEAFSAEAIQNLACDKKAAPHAARGMLDNGVLVGTGTHLNEIRDKMRSGHKDIANCPGVAGFTDKDWADLDKLSPPSQKP